MGATSRRQRHDGSGLGDFLRRAAHHFLPHDWPSGQVETVSDTARAGDQASLDQLLLRAAEVRGQSESTPSQAPLETSSNSD